MTLEEITVAALSRGAEFSNEFPSTRSVHYRRIGMREQQLMVRAAEINVDYFGKSTSIALVAGAANLSTLNPVAERISGVRINDVGTSVYTTGRRVNIVPIDDSSYSGLAPRATLRDYILTQVGTDLDGVTSVLVDYSKRPSIKAVGGDVPELPVQFHELFVIDDVKSMLRRIGWKAGSPEVQKAYAMMVEEENEYLADFESHIERFQLAEESRFGRTARPLSRPKAEA